MWEMFFFKNHAENETGTFSFCFSKKLCCIKKPVVSTLVLTYFGRHQPGEAVKTNLQHLM